MTIRASAADDCIYIYNWRGIVMSGWAGRCLVDFYTLRSRPLHTTDIGFRDGGTLIYVSRKKWNSIIRRKGRTMVPIAVDLPEEPTDPIELLDRYEHALSRFADHYGINLLRTLTALALDKEDARQRRRMKVIDTYRDKPDTLRAKLLPMTDYQDVSIAGTSLEDRVGPMVFVVPITGGPAVAVPTSWVLLPGEEELPT